MKRVYKPYTDWEDWKNGMYRNVDRNEREKLSNDCLNFMKSCEEFGKAMRRVVNEWPSSCEQNLTAINSNRRSWIGQAACTLALKCPEDITRAMWGKLNLVEQQKANRMADKVISEWERKYETKTWQIHFYLEA